jgi:hypothetical protein
MGFADQVNKFTKKAKGRSLKVFQVSVIEVFGRVVRRTPVDTGRLRGNWQIDINKTPSGTKETVDPSGSAFTREVTGKSKRLDIGDTAVMVNNLPYAKPIEEGSSTQAPRGMVAVTRMEFRRIVERIAKGIR